jgi:hypothetical protein
VVGDEVAPRGIDITRPNVARVYDFMIGGKDHFAVDRMAAERALTIIPDAREAGRSCRAFLRRVVRYMAADVGIRQFLDIGSGLPTDTNVHQVAHSVDPAARTVYVDNDPMVLVHGRALLASNPNTMVIEADIRSPEEILEHPVVRDRLDFTEPIGLLLLSILHHLHDAEDPGGIAATLRSALPSGSHLAIIHFWNPVDEHPHIAAKVLDAEREFNESLGTGRWRLRSEIESYFGDFEMIEPGLVPMAEWRPNGEPTPEKNLSYYTMLGGVARKP